MKYPVRFLEDFANYKKDDETDKISGDIVSNLIKRGVLELIKEASKKENEKLVKEHWKTVVENIENSTSLEELEQFRSDNRKSVQKALEAKILELTEGK